MNAIKKQVASAIIKHIDSAFDRPCGESYWLDEKMNRISGIDVGYAWEWWRDCMRPELCRLFEIND